MKQKYLNGGSPDLTDMFMMNEWFELNRNLIKNVNTVKRSDYERQDEK
jgi:hypothetical protein